MGDMLTTGLAWLHEQRATAMTSPAFYYADGASLGRRVFVTIVQSSQEQIDANGYPVIALVMDFIASASDFVDLPARGDIVLYSGRRYEVTPQGQDECFRYTDASRLALRIHTRDLGPEVTA